MTSRLLGIVRAHESVVIEGLYVGEHAWVPGGSAFVKVPGENGLRNAQRCTTKDRERTAVFIATELSNEVWGFFTAEAT